ncbi:ComEC/Rec2 family competence protein [Microbacterium aureliae]
MRLVPAAAAAWGVAGVLILHPDAAPWAALALWCATLGLLAHLARPGPPRRAGLLAVIAGAALAAATASHIAFAAPLRAEVATLVAGDGRAVSVEAVVTGKIEPRAGGRVAFDAVTRTVTVGADARPAEVPIEIWMTGEAVAVLVPGPRLDVGSELRAAGSARSARPGERAVFVLSAGTPRTEVTAGPPGILEGAAALRADLLAAVRTLPGPGAGLIPGLSVGDTSAVSAELDAQMKASSLSHLTAVSGANCALVVAIAYLVAAAAGAPRGARVAAGAVVLGAFVVLVTPEPSVVRAATMALIAMAALLLGRAGAGIAVLSVAVAILLVVDPWLAASLGFALSTTATASLLILARPLSTALARVMPRALALSVSVPLAAQLACGPLLILIEPTVPTYGVVANLLAGPAAPAATVLGLLACLTAAIPPLAAGFATIAWVPASWIAATAATTSTLPAGALPWGSGPIGAAALAGIGTLVVVALVAADGWRRRTARAGLLAAAGVMAGVLALATWAAPWTVPHEWAVLQCDVGQGDAMLLRSGDAVALVDTGPDPEALERCLAQAGVADLDLLVLTHFDRDHAGAASVLTGRVAEVLHGPAGGDAAAILRGLAAAGAHTRHVAAGDAGALGAAHWRVLWPDAAVRAWPPGNDASVVLEVGGGGIPRSLLLGDLSEAPQRALLRSGGWRPPYAVVKVAHHGSADQLDELYERAAPSLAIVSVGDGNGYGHPRDEILGVLRGLGARTVRTDLDGAVAVWPTAGGVAVWRENGGVADRR